MIFLRMTDMHDVWYISGLPNPSHIPILQELPREFLNDKKTHSKNARQMNRLANESEAARCASHFGPNTIVERKKKQADQGSKTSRYAVNAARHVYILHLAQGCINVTNVLAAWQLLDVGLSGRSSQRQTAARMLSNKALCIRFELATSSPIVRNLHQASPADIPPSDAEPWVAATMQIREGLQDCKSKPQVAPSRAYIDVPCDMQAATGCISAQCSNLSPMPNILM